MTLTTRAARKIKINSSRRGFVYLTITDLTTKQRIVTKLTQKEALDLADKLDTASEMAALEDACSN